MTHQSNGHGSRVTIKACGPLTSLVHQFLNSTFCYMYLQPKHISHFLIEKLQKKNRIKNLEHITEPWFKKNVVAFYINLKLKKSIRCQRSQQQKVPNFLTHMCICCIRCFFYFKNNKKRLN